jgi:sulfur-oxidizing protein SoxZ
MAERTILHVPSPAKAGEIVEIRVTIQHPMETGYRVDNDGKVMLRNLVRRFSCQFEGQTVFAAELHAAVAANPYIAFPLRAQRSGTLLFSWEGDRGFAHSETRPLVVT